jgi:CRISPR-associated endonuclease Csn1
MTYTLGIDMGIASIGFAGVDEPNKNIHFCGVHIFEAAENPKDGASLAQPRREKRGLRKVIRRRMQRKQAIRRLLIAHDLLDVESIDRKQAPTGKNNTPLSVWDWRKAALERALTDAEFAHVLFHIAKRRGFQSNRKGAEPNDVEGKKVLSSAKELQEKMERANARTVGAYLAEQPKKRNSDGSYENSTTRDLLRDEVRQIFSSQRTFGNAKATEALQREYEELAFFQRPLQSSEKLVGNCTLEQQQKRAPKFSYSAELFILWSNLNHVRIRSMNGDERPLSPDEKQRLAALAHERKELTYTQARKVLALTDDERFNISYRKVKDEDNSWEKIRAFIEKSAWLKLPGHHALKAALDTGSAIDWQNWINRDRQKLNDIARILSFHEDEAHIRTMLEELGVGEGHIPQLLAITQFNRTIDLSVKAVERILPHMQQGLTYDKACKEAGYDHSRKTNLAMDTVPVLDDIRNPVVNRAMAQARKVINACIRQHGMPKKIIIELARDVGRSFKDRKDIEREQKKNQAYREEARQHMAEILGMLPDNVRGENITKYRLWTEQNGTCPYSGVYIDPERLRDSAATQIDHIIPYQRSWNDSYMNKVLCLASENQEKRNSTPVEYFTRTGRNLDILAAFALRLPQKKAETLLLENFDEEKANTWKERALNDTRYMARLLKNHLAQSLSIPVEARNGALTANLRGLWGFNDKNRSNDRHHALDAIVIAFSTQSMVQKVADWHRNKRSPEKPRVEKPWDTFREDALAAVEKVFVSRMPVRKITGAAHEETIRSIRETGDGGKQVIQRVKLRSLSPAMLENLVDKDRNMTLYTTLKSRLDAFDGKPDKAFAEEIYMPSKNKESAPRILSVRVVTNEKSGVPINHGLASNGDMVRVDVFQKNGKYFLVPVYVHHFAAKELPNKAILSGKPEEQWEVMYDRDFLFSLYRNDFVRIKNKKEDITGYYVTTDRANGSIALRAHDNNPSFGKDGLMRGIGVKTLLAFEKYTVDYFGNILPKQPPGIREKRVGLANSDDSESSTTEPVERAAAAEE